MKNILLNLGFLLLCASSYAQASNFYGLARKSATPDKVYLSTVDAATGVVTNLSSGSLSTTINLTGAALNPYANSYYFIANDSIKTIDLSTGNLTNVVKINNPIAGTFFDNFRFNNSDSILYGLAREIDYDTSTGKIEMYFASVNPATGVVTKISTTSIGASFALSGNAIDPYQKIFYYTTGKGIANLVGIDMYNGKVYSNPSIKTSINQHFENFTYSCVDTGIYGLLRENFYTYTPSPIDTDKIIQRLDSTWIHLSKIEPSTGTITKISPKSLGNFPISMNASSTIDPTNKIYYFGTGTDLIGVSLTTGLQVTRQKINNVDGDYFDLMRISSNCEDAIAPMRLASPTSILSVNGQNKNAIYPNPSSEYINIKSDQIINDLTISNTLGSIVYKTQVNEKSTSINVSSFPSGIYFIHQQSKDGNYTQYRFVKQ